METDKSTEASGTNWYITIIDMSFLNIVWYKFYTFSNKSTKIKAIYISAVENGLENAFLRFWSNRKY